MINIENAIKEFIKYSEQYDLNNSNILRKQQHSLRVMELSKQIAISNDLPEEDIILATLIGLLHDIARFEQEKQFHTFNDLKSFDHGDFGVEILKKDNFIRKFIKEDTYDDIIYNAIKYHNKYAIADGLNEKELLHAKIIRDADKIDIIYLTTNTFYSSNVSEVENSLITERVYNEFCSGKLVVKSNELTKADNIIITFAFIYDLNFDYSKKYLNEKKYFDQILDRFNFKNEKTKDEIKEVKNIIHNYLMK